MADIFSPDERRELGRALGEDLADDFAAFLSDRLGPYLKFLGQEEGPESVRIAAAAFAKALRHTADALERNPADS